MDDQTKKIILELKITSENIGKSARSLADEIGSSHTTITRMFNFESIPNLDIIVKVARALKVDLFNIK
ncbi:helix-turn-helix domain-containing protein [Empedobacter sp. ULE_I145]|uniref:helix-turn-helix domain-containing protein n=1 Tax=Empedobacter falsenii TaxID=343874 RepID=UPI001C8DDD31|nr:helix-turn-helix transcriptional regulator [Empedobacter falsenii]MBY0066831.1 helix-turn-helix domain-containing protein [Empedobacter falsenii]